MATNKQQLDFVNTLYPAAKRLYDTNPGNSIHPLFIVAQAALETGWQIRGIDNNIFGITKGSTWTGKTRLMLTTEYFTTSNKTFTLPERIVSVIPVEGGKYKYSVYRLFRVYNTLEECLSDHLAILKKPGYEDAWPYRNDPAEYARRIVDTVGAKYATDPNYAGTLISVINRVKSMI